MSDSHHLTRTVRYHSLTLAGFGCYEQPTRFVLAGRSRVFVSNNERGKTTFLKGLLYTLFGTPPGRRREAFRRKYWHWNQPKDFWAELSFTANGVRWTVRRDFRRDRVTVLREHRVVLEKHRHRQRAQPDPDDPYQRLLNEWLGLQDPATFELLFCIDQNSTVVTRSQIDERLWDYIYGPEVIACEQQLRTLYEQFRELSSRTRDHDVVLDSLGSRNGKTPGRCDQLEERHEKLRQRETELEHELQELQSRLTACRDRLPQPTDVEQLHAAVTAWERWCRIQRELAEQLHFIEKAEACLQEDNGPPSSPWTSKLALSLPPEEFSQWVRHGAEWQQRFCGAQERLREIEDALARSKEEAEQWRSEAERLAPWAHAAENIEQLRRLKKACSLRAAALTAAREAAQLETEKQLWTELSGLKRLVSELRDLDERERQLHAELQAAREAVEQARREHAQAQQLWQKHLQEQAETERQHQALRRRIEELNDRLEREFPLLIGAPPELPRLWDRLRTLRDELRKIDEIQGQLDLQIRIGRTRRTWRRTLLTAGSLVCALTWYLARDFIDWIFLGAALGLTHLSWRAFPRPPLEELQQQASQLRLRRRSAEQEIRSIERVLGDRFRLDHPEAERMREQWPTYNALQEELTRLRAQLDQPNGSEAIRAHAEAVREELLEAVHTAEAELKRSENHQRQLEATLSETLERKTDLTRRADELSRKLFGLSLSDLKKAELEHLGEDWIRRFPNLPRKAPVLSAMDDLPAEPPSPAETTHRHLVAEATALGIVPAEGGSLGLQELLDRLDHCIAQARKAVEPANEQTDEAWLREQQQEHAEALALEHEAEKRIHELTEKLHGVQAELAELEANRPDDWPILESLLQTKGPEELIRDYQAFWTQREHRRRQLAELGVADVEELAGRLQEAKQRVEALRSESTRLLEEYPFLVSALEQPPEYAEQQLREAEARLQALQAEEERLKDEIERLEADAQRLEDELSRLRTELEDVARELEASRRRRDELAARFRELRHHYYELKAQRRADLEGRITALFAQFSCSPQRRVALDDEFRLSIVEGSRRYAPGHLSHGARDQLTLAVYLALAHQLDLPFVFDDPFVNCDEERLQAIERRWKEQAAARQFILLAHSPRFAAWAEPVEVQADWQRQAA